MPTRKELVNTRNIPQRPGDSPSPLEPVRRLSDAELRVASAAFVSPAPFVAEDPYRPVDLRAQRVSFYQPSYVRGCEDSHE